METYRLVFYLIITSYLRVGVLNVQNFGPQPRIISTTGHLIFNSADNKNIHFLTKGNGKIMLNGADLTDATNLARNASITINRVNSEIHDTYFQVKKFKVLLEGRQGILERLHMLESGGIVGNISFPGATGGGSTELSVTVLNRRFRVLHRRVNRLISLLTRNECSSNPCKNGGTCQDLFNGFICICPTEWEGFECDKDVNECARFAGTDLGCQNGATCINKPGSYECICMTGWFGIHCTRGTNSCSSGSVTELCGHGTCIPQNGGVGYKCICDQGWTFDERNVACTKDIDECVMSKPPCSTSPSVPCVNTPGSFSCGNCPLGYTGNGYYCTDLDECALFNGGCSMNPVVQCINTPGSRVCGMCPPGYIGDGASCSFKGLCGVNNGGCHYFAQCKENPRISSTYVECICASGYVGSGIGPSGCVRSSEIGDPCAGSPCLHGVCVSNNVTGTYSCICNSKFTGKNCDIRKDPCQSNPCYNGGTCQNIANLSYKCTCTAGYTGDRCDIERQACGGRLVHESGILKYPATQSIISSHLISCAWIIETNSSKILNITFTSFHLDASPNCRFDWLQIHDGRNSASQSLGRFCGNTFPNGGTITSSHNVLYLWFRSDPSISNSGFELKWSSIEPICGATLQVATHGTLKSPGFPGNYPPNRDCFWSLYAPISKRFQFHFFSLDIGNNPNCSFDYLTIYQGYATTGRVLAKYCNTSHPEPLYSSGPEVLVHFHSNAKNSYPGFQIAYSVVEGIPGCGGVYTANEGEVASPAIDGDYPPDINCEYKIKVHEKSRIKITFLSFELEDEENCSNDFLTIHEGSSSKAPLINRYCGNKIPASFTSSANEIFIVFSSDWGTNKGGFRLKYETICGGVYSAPSGIIESPGYPNPYSEDQTCIYEIAQPLGTIIQLTFLDFKLETLEQQQCIFDYIEIHDGDSEKSALIGRYCYKSPPSILSSYNYLWFKFESDSSIAASGFQAKYNTTKIGCGGILKTNMGVVRSPEHAKTYASNTVCTWIIVAPPGYVIQLTWLLFRLEQSSTCSFDYVEVYENRAKRERIGKYCGSTSPPTLMSSSNSLIIKFGTDNSINFDGFMATYSFLNEQNACGGRYFTSSGILKTPFYPEQYPPNRECVWVITVEKGQQIMLNVTDFFMEPVPRCNYDYLEIRNGGSKTSPLIGRYCGTQIPKQIPSHANQMYITFKSDSSHAFRGFKIYWEATTTGCGGHLTSPRGSITSPYYPEPYLENTVCHWTISVSAGSLIQIIFADIELEGHACLMDYLEIFDGPTTFSPSLGKFCHPISQPFIISTSNHVTLKFRSDASMQQRGFHIQYSTLCQNTLKGFRGVIESPNFPNNFPQHQDCLWKIQVALGNKINISFSHFELESITVNGTKNCLSNFVQIKYNTENEESFTKGTYCGLKIPPQITISENNANIHFISDEFARGTGFRLEWKIVGCGGRVTHPSGTLTTPNYPVGYPRSTQCDWILEMEYGRSIQINFAVIDFETSGNCAYDYIMITNGPDDTYPLLTKTCIKGSKPLTVTSTGNFMYIKFVSDASYRGKGFWANYTTLATKCGGLFTAASGTITSPNYPKNYDKKDSCAWLIDIEETHIIELKFGSVDLAGDCKKNYIKVYDGPTSASPVIASLCGNNKSNYTVKSSYNQLFVQMVTNDELTAKGFLANYSTGCGARIITQSSGIITISEILTAVPEVVECSWTVISSDPSQHVSLTITHMELFGCYSTDDSGYPVKIYGGESNTAPVIGKFCEDKLPPTITSSGNALHIDVNSVSVKFSAKYSVLDSACGGSLTSKEGSFATPRYPNNYPMDIQCEWIVQVAPGNRASLSFTTFDLVTSDNCHMDYVEIRAGGGNGKHLGTFCKSIPTNITQVGSLWILFRSSRIPADGAGTAKGFLAEYALEHGIDLTGPSGEIASPLYPNYYLKGDPFNWRITVNFSKLITISFEDFYVEASSPDDSYGAAVEVFDGFDDTAPILKRFSGTTIPDSIKSSSNIIYLKFMGNSFGHGSKFFLKWFEVEGSSKSSMLSPKQKVGKCGSDEVINMSNMDFYNITSPGYPFGYAQNLKCQWIFSVEPEFHFEIAIWKMDLENIIAQCLLDTVKIYTGNNGIQDWSIVATFCLPNATSEPSIVTGNLLKVEFTSDSYMNGTGFEGVITKHCGGSIKASNGIIAVEDTQSYSCQWNVTVGPGRTIKVEFLKLDMENVTKGTCPNYVVLRNGNYPESPFLGIGRYCTSTIPEPLYTTGNQLYVKYVGQPGNTFKLSYEEVSLACGGTITLTKYEKSVNISSPNYPNVPPAYSECIWTIIAPPAESLRIDFEDRFDITSSSECSLAAVEVRDGGTKYSLLLGKFCDEMPNTTFSSDNMLYVRFFTEAEEPRNGFKAVVSIAFCGGIIRSSEGEIRSPNFNNKKLYPKNINCIWHIVAPTSHYVKIHFDVIDLEYSATGCRYVDHVAIEERSLLNGTIRTIGEYCGNEIPGEVRSSTNEVFVHLITGNNQDMLSGFKLLFNSSEDVCGGSLNTESGVIQSPGYPIAYSSRECEWLIRVPEGRRITFEFIDLNMNILGYEEGLAFFNDKEYKSSITFTKDLNVSVPIKSSSNTMVVLYWGYHHSYRGFQARYSSNEATICSGDFTQKSGTIKTINASTYYCTWKHDFNGLASQTLAISILMTASETDASTTSCTNSGVVVSSGNNEGDMAKLCKLLKHPLTIRSPYPITKIVAYQDKYPPKLDYTITYVTHSCGGIITGQIGEITSPGFPNKQSTQLECTWLLKFPSDQQIKLTFINFNLDTTCENNYVVVYNGDTPYSPKIGLFCQNNKPVHIQSESNSLWIEYHNNEKSTGTGFKLNYEPVINGCGGTFHDDIRIIETPQYPIEYPNNTECLWEIIAKNGYHINLAFINRFYIEQSEKCLNDFIEVWDFKDDEWISLGKKCGRDTPLSMNSTSNKMKIMFRSNDKIRAIGFMARWSIHCGGTFVADEKIRYIVSPGYPYDYSYNLLCVYKIISSKSHVNIVFEDFQLESDINCRYDNVSIQPAMSGGSYVHIPSDKKYYCGVNTPPIIRQRGDVIITFATDSWINRSGFKFRYNTDSCGGIINSPSVINSPITSTAHSVSKLFYGGAVHCVWNITAPSNKNVMLSFIAFEFEHNSYCSFDSVAVYDGLTVNESSRLALLCGNLTQQLPTIKSSSNQMTVVMKTDYTNHYSGFKALVYFNWGPSAGCGGVVDVKDTSALESPTGLDFLDCHWKIVTSKDFVLKITFTEVNLEKCPNNTLFGNKNCSCSLIEVRDGGGPFSELIDLWCHNNVPREFTTSANSAWIRLYRFGHSATKAFRATITKVPSICGPSVLNVTNQTQTLTSPLFPQPYPNNIKCTWVLKGHNFLEKFYLRFTEFDLAEMSVTDFIHHKCLSDKVEIADKMSSNVITEGLGTATVFSGSKSAPVYGGQRMPVGVHQYCGRHALSFDHYSGENEVFVTFTSGSNNIHGKGFKIEYQTAGCNRNYTSVQGRLMNSQLQGDCIITITAPENYTISIYFLVFIMYDTNACEGTGFEVHDGNSSAAPLIAKLCGYTLPDPIFSTGNKLWIRLWQKQANNVAFYDATYTSSTSPKGCGGIFYNYVGKFTSPAYPTSYRKMDTCVWEIMVPQDTQVALKFTVFDIAGSCTNDYVEVITYNADGSNEVKHRFCKDDNPAVLRTENNRMMVKYTTTVNNGGTGWIAQFLAVTADSNLDWLF